MKQNMQMVIKYISEKFVFRILHKLSQMMIFTCVFTLFVFEFLLRHR